MKRKRSVKESIDMVVTKETILDSRFTSFLEKDHSFLTPWSWNPNASKNETSSTKKKEFLSFHPESYFSYEIIDRKCWNDNAQETDNQCCPSTSSCSQACPAPLIFVNQAPRCKMCNRSNLKMHSDVNVQDPKSAPV
ncbi:hypothetical protein MtrunA17_Chr2g0292071 [Medicago truncatula]|uniref:Uncharacterized protein n=1 Tax=Medicago truncatula TaxID=3880 RepID=A0A072V5E1_MEDTR|nr:hypothetical protein MTR_2g029530 [Medicago truncatula]RHN72836.1 hypothetical protein MtrunA17_Chr2g0292071 [Medicago truncatula]